MFSGNQSISSMSWIEISKQALVWFDMFELSYLVRESLTFGSSPEDVLIETFHVTFNKELEAQYPKFKVQYPDPIDLPETVIDAMEASRAWLNSVQFLVQLVQKSPSSDTNNN
jgi:hypothetical protein